jgi:uncharacterized protein YqeY
MSEIKHRLQEDSNDALRSGDKPKLGALRLVLAAVKQQEVDTRKDLDDAAVLDIIGKMIKKGRDAAAQFAAAGREDLAGKETMEVTYFEAYMPAQLSAAELSAVIAAAIEDTGASSIKDMGNVMAAVKIAAAGRADMATVSGLVRQALAKI